MNIEIKAIKDDIVRLTKQVHDLETIVLSMKPTHSRYFYIHYTLDYFEPIQVQKLLEDIQERKEISFEKVFVLLTQEEDKTYHNPVLGISLYHISLQIWAVSHHLVGEDKYKNYFQEKFGRASVHSFAEWKDFKKDMDGKEDGITTYRCIHGVWSAEKSKGWLL